MPQVIPQALLFFTSIGLSGGLLAAATYATAAAVVTAPVSRFATNSAYREAANV